jgi:glucarate dehydratase
MRTNRRGWLKGVAAGAIAGSAYRGAIGDDSAVASGGLKSDRAGRFEGSAPLLIKSFRVTPIALPDPPILAASGCHGPYFLRTIVEIETDGGFTGVGEIPGSERNVLELERSLPRLIKKNAFAYRSFKPLIGSKNPAIYSAIETACLDACGQAKGLRVCELLGGPVRREIELAAYLFYRYASDDPRILDDRRIVDDRGRGEKALDDWGEVRTPEAMAKEAERFKKQWGFNVFKLKGGVLRPEVEVETLRAIHAKLGPKAQLRIDPNARWRVETAIKFGKSMRDLPMEYYEDPVQGQEGMAEVRREVGLPTSTNMCVTKFEHVPEALRVKPIDVVLCDHHYWGGITACVELGRVAEFAGWRVGQHSNSHTSVSFAAMLHVAALIPNLTSPSDTHIPWLPERFDIVEGSRIKIENGKASLPESAGLGVVIDRDKLARAHEIYVKCGMKNRDDGSLMRKMEPGWKADLF